MSGTADDRRDGFLHLSTKDQLPETARKHFSGQEGLMLLAVDREALGAALVWEPARQGELFPHLYAQLFHSAVLWARPLRLAPDGTPLLPEDLA